MSQHLTSSSGTRRLSRSTYHTAEKVLPFARCKESMPLKRRGWSVPEIYAVCSRQRYHNASSHTTVLESAHSARLLNAPEEKMTTWQGIRGLLSLTQPADLNRQHLHYARKEVPRMPPYRTDSTGTRRCKDLAITRPKHTTSVLLLLALARCKEGCFKGMP